jgi:hypothetical protein
VVVRSCVMGPVHCVKVVTVVVRSCVMGPVHCVKVEQQPSLDTLNVVSLDFLMQVIVEFLSIHT